MKKLLALLIALTLTISLVACVGPCDPERNPDTPPIGPNPDDNRSENSGAMPEGSFEPDAALIDAVSDYLYLMTVAFDLGPISLSTKLDMLKEGARMLLVDVPADDCYFLAAYCADGHDMCDVGHSCTEQTWLAFTAADRIPEKYNGMDILAAFQVNRASTYLDVATDTAVDSPAGMFTLMDTAFEDGYNTAAPLTCSDIRVHFTTAEETALYYSQAHPLGRLRTANARLIDGEYYVLQPFYIYEDGGARVVRIDLREEYCDYYFHLRTLTDVFHTFYRELDENGNGTCYGLIKPRDIITVVNTPEYDSPYDDPTNETTLTADELDGLHIPQYLAPAGMSSFHYLDLAVVDGLVTCSHGVDNTLIGELTLVDNPSFEYGESTLSNITHPTYGQDYTEYLDHEAIYKVIRTAETCYAVRPTDNPDCTSDLPLYLFRIGDELFVFRAYDGEKIAIVYRITLD